LGDLEVRLAMASQYLSIGNLEVAERLFQQLLSGYPASPNALGYSLVSTYRALGGGWQMRSGNSYVDPDTLNEMRERTNWGELLDN